jgi:hypothetical protein
VEHLIPLFPQGERSLLACVVEKLNEYHYRVNVGQVIREQDLGLVGAEIGLDLTEDTEILWIGDDTMDVGTWLDIRLPEAGSVAPGDALAPEEITLQNGTGEIVTPGRD